jgi:predicted secreted hydrolase
LIHGVFALKALNDMQKRILIGLIALVLLLIGGVWLLRPARSQEISATLSVSEALADNTEGFARVTEPRPFSFPADHGPHNEYKTEWWYYTGNLDTADGRHFGYQLTFFRSGVTPEPADRDSAWATQNIYMAHFALTDVAGRQFYAFDRFSRDGAGLAGAQADPFRVWTESWEASGDPETGTRLTAAQGPVAIDLVARSLKPPVLQGEDGYSRKSSEPGAASYYYSLTRMATDGTITIDGESFAVSGFSWLDREWSTSILAPNQTGWDWFALQFDDDREMKYFQIRLDDGGVEPISHGSLVAPDGAKTELALDEVRLDVLDSWTSPHTGARYPSRWRLQVPGEQMDLTIEPFINDQELRISFVYWEGAVRFTGTWAGQAVSGVGYVEMTGYGEPERSTTSRTR